MTQDEKVAVPGPVILRRLLAGEDLTRNEAASTLRAVMRGDVAATTLSGFLVALAAKGETPEEIAGFVEAMVEAAVHIDVPGPLTDTCGTGGDGHDTFNISTVAALVAAAAGVPVAKHGNRAASSRCGSADVLEAMGVVIDLAPEHVATTIRELGIGFMFARSFHPAMRHVGPVRAELGVRTIFNILGPLSNPAGAAHQVVGVGDAKLGPVIAQALANLGKRAMVFHGSDGLDELTTTGTSQVWDVVDGVVTEGVVDPADLGIARSELADLVGGDVAENVEIAGAVLRGDPGPRADIVALNAGAAIFVSGAAESLAEGVSRAQDVLVSGAAEALRDRWVARSQELAADGA